MNTRQKIKPPVHSFRLDDSTWTMLELAAGPCGNVSAIIRAAIRAYLGRPAPGPGLASGPTPEARPMPRRTTHSRP